MTATSAIPLLKCYHCGDVCGHDPVRKDDKVFCCDGCKTVYELIADNGLCSYYHLQANAGVAPGKLNFNGKFAFLDETSIQEKLLTFRDEAKAHVTFHLPQMHCASCVWLLEHLYRLDAGINASRSDFLRKEVAIEFNPSKTSLRQVVELLTTISYEPALHLDDLEKKRVVNPQRQRVYRIAVAGFCFSNIMLLSFPEYFHIADTGDVRMQEMFGYLNLLLALPVLLYSGAEFYLSAWKGLRAKFLNIDVPLALSIVITFGRSVYDIFTGIGIGYLDSMSGIIFFMLIGRYFQERTYSNLQFDRNYKSYFPISISVKTAHGEEGRQLSALKCGDEMIVRSQELIPADSTLLSPSAMIDYSFVTGESKPVRVMQGQLVYAGGRNTGATVDLSVQKQVKQSYLTGLWNKDAFQEEKRAEEQSFVHKMARNFTVVLLLLSVGGLLYWWPTDFQRGLNALTTVLIVACPCALLLSLTFTNGAVMRVLARNAFYVKNALVIEKLRDIGTVVFDKTGTITVQGETVHYHGASLSSSERSAVASLVGQSNHPLSKAIAKHLSVDASQAVELFQELPGKGLTGMVNGVTLVAGSAEMVGEEEAELTLQSRVYIAFNGAVKGYFAIENAYREGLTAVVQILSRDKKLAVISGDNDAERKNLKQLFPVNTELKFGQRPEDKLHFIEHLQSDGLKVAMVGDGLNDAGALRQSEVGIAISDNVNNFSPACDVIMESKSFHLLPELFEYAKWTRRIVLGSFVLSLLYNVVGVSIALSGDMKPVFAAILMPLSSISIVLFTTGASLLVAKRLGLR